jgi:hypothetical protein
VPVLKTNSVQGVLVLGSREKRVSWEAEELIIRVHPFILGNTSSGLKFLGPVLRPDSGGSSGRRSLRDFSLLPRAKGCTRKANSLASAKFICRYCKHLRLPCRRVAQALQERAINYTLDVPFTSMPDRPCEVVGISPHHSVKAKRTFSHGDCDLANA